MNVTIADVLHRAADEFLALERHEYWMHDGKKEKYSCCAVSGAVFSFVGHNRTAKGIKLHQRVRTGLERMGCELSSLTVFPGDPSVESKELSADVQNARYAWLKFAALIAEEQGV